MKIYADVGPTENPKTLPKSCHFKISVYIQQKFYYLRVLTCIILYIIVGKDIDMFGCRITKCTLWTNTVLNNEMRRYSITKNS